MSLANALRPMRCGLGQPKHAEKSAGKAALSGPIFGFLVAFCSVIDGLELGCTKAAPYTWIRFYGELSQCGCG